MASVLKENAESWQRRNREETSRVKKEEKEERMRRVAMKKKKFGEKLGKETRREKKESEENLRRRLLLIELKKNLKEEKKKKAELLSDGWKSMIALLEELERNGEEWEPIEKVVEEEEEEEEIKVEKKRKKQPIEDNDKKKPRLCVKEGQCQQTTILQYRHMWGGDGGATHSYSCSIPVDRGEGGSTERVVRGDGSTLKKLTSVLHEDTTVRGLREASRIPSEWKLARRDK